MNTELDTFGIDLAVKNISIRAELLKKWAKGSPPTLKEERRLANARMYWLFNATREINDNLSVVLANATVRKQLEKIPGTQSLLLVASPTTAEIASLGLFLVLETKDGAAPYVWFYKNLENPQCEKIEVMELREIKHPSFWNFWELPLLALSTPEGLARFIVRESFYF